MADGMKLGTGLTLPLDAVTQVVAFLGRRGSGKTYAAMKLAELMLTAEAQIIALDPVGTWWGLRLKADGTGAGFAIPVFGGLHGDVPLEPTGGALIADLLADRGISAVLDVSQMTSGEQAQFAYAFATRFFQRKKAASSAVHLFVEECQEFVPQNIGKGDGPFAAKMLHAFERLIKLGRNFGIGVSLISQRPQEVNKKVLNQSELLLAFQMTGPQERKAIQGWVSDKGLAEDLNTVLPYLKTGEPHVWSPQWLQISKTTRILPKRTFDASSTPKVGAARAEARPLAPVDLERIREAMAATIERSKADDPKELRRRIAELERELRTAKAQAPAVPEPERIEVPVIRDHQIQALHDTVEGMGAVGDRVRLMVDELKAELARVTTVMRRPVAVAPSSNVRAPRVVPSRRQDTPARRDAGSTPAGASATNLSVPQVRILNALGFLASVGLPLANKTQLALLAEASPKSSAYQNNLGALRSAGLIDYPAGGVVTLTPEGSMVAYTPDEPLTSEDLQERLLSRLSGPQRRILEALIDSYPAAVHKNTLADLADASATSSAYQNNLGSLRSLGVIDYPQRGMVAALPLLFIEAGR